MGLYGHLLKYPLNRNIVEEYERPTEKPTTFRNSTNRLKLVNDYLNIINI